MPKTEPLVILTFNGHVEEHEPKRELRNARKLVGKPVESGNYNKKVFQKGWGEDRPQLSVVGNSSKIEPDWQTTGVPKTRTHILRDGVYALLFKGELNYDSNV